ncbi:ferredoxin reductase [Nocardia sp. NPDC059239]|uniref:ferredoxin reductase n=1 Tax=Nocardia sp. NPDC059239 TaxID=3346785 RepID=UPI00367C0164
MAVVEKAESMNVRRTVLVESVEWEAKSVLSLTLVDPDGAKLPEWHPGDHIDVILPSGLIRQYSLCGRTDDLGHYRIAVLGDDNGRGGSIEVHDTPLVGKAVDIVGSRNNFVFRPASAYVAAGIGITPTLPMIRAASASGMPWSCRYRCHRFRRAQYYCCGPNQMIAAAELACGASNPPHELHMKEFGTQPKQSTPQMSSDSGEFEVEFARFGVVLTVPADRTLLDIIREACLMRCSPAERAIAVRVRRGC